MPFLFIQEGLWSSFPTGHISPSPSSDWTTQAYLADPNSRRERSKTSMRKIDSIAVRDAEFSKLENPHIGSELELNDYRGVIVGTAKVTTSGLYGTPTLCTTYERAIQYVPNPRYTISDVLVEPKSAGEIRQIKQQVEALGYRARTKSEFMQRTADFYIYQTGGGANMLIMTAISFIVGLSISGQTFYSLILENLERFGALKAIGTKSRDLVGMILLQATLRAFTVYGLGVGLCALWIWLAR